MTGKKIFQITVPGSTSNLGPGFDSIGLAVSRYLTLDVEQSDEWEFIPKSIEIDSIPRGKDNLIFQVCDEIAKKFNCNLPPCRVEVMSDIPLARGLGSSASAIVAAIELTNEVCQLQLTKQQKLALACSFEGHPDNVSPSLYGGLVIGCHRGEENTDIIHIPHIDFDIVVVIPPYEIKTKDARSVLPSQLSYQSAVEASAISNVLVASLLTNNFELAGKMMDLDLFHQPYRKELIVEYDQIEKTAKSSGAFGVAISGAGPTVICYAEKGNGKVLKDVLKAKFEHCLVEELAIENEGSTVIHFTSSSK